MRLANCSSPLMASIGPLVTLVSRNSTTPSQWVRIVVASLRKGSSRLRVARRDHQRRPCSSSPARTSCSVSRSIIARPQHGVSSPQRFTRPLVAEQRPGTSGVDPPPHGAATCALHQEPARPSWPDLVSGDRSDLKFPRFSGQAGCRGSRKDIHHAQVPSDLRQRLPLGSRRPPDQQPAPLEGGGDRTRSLGQLAAHLA